MKTRHKVLVALSLMLTLQTSAQNTRVEWFAVGGGIGQGSAANTVVLGMTSQTVTGSSSASDVMVRSGFLAYPFSLGAVTDLGGDREAAPLEYWLSQNYPNPFNPSTTIKYALPAVTQVRLVVYDLLGREVAVLVDEKREAGMHEVKFDADNMASGFYLYKLTAGSFIQTRKMIVVK